MQLVPAGTRQARAPSSAHLGEHFPDDRPPRQFQVGRPAQRGALRGRRRPRGGRRGRRPLAGRGLYGRRNPHQDYDDYDQDDYDDAYDNNEVVVRPRDRRNKSPLVIQVVDDRASKK